MARDIEEFLRRAAERRKKNQQGGGRPPKSDPPPQPTPPPAPRPPVARRETRTPTALPSKQPAHESVADHVRRAIDVSDVADVTEVTDHAGQLAEVIELADDHMDQHVHDVFDHEVRSINEPNSSSPSPGKTVSPFARDLLDLFKSQKSVRQAILVNEILKRPDFNDEDF